MDDSNELPEDVQKPSKVGWLTTNRSLWLLAGAALIATATFCIITWANRWDSPETEYRTLASGNLSYKGNSIQVTVTSNCPLYLIESRNNNIPLTVSLKTLPPNRTRGPEPRTPEPLLGHHATPTDHELPTNGESAKDLTSSEPALTVYTWIQSPAAIVKIQDIPPNGAYDIGPERQLGSGIQNEVPLSITPSTSGALQVSFSIRTYDANTKQESNDKFTPEALLWRPTVRPAFIIAKAPLGYSALAFLFALVLLLLVVRRFGQLRWRTEQQLLEVRNQATARPGETHFAWENARIKLEAYFDRNLLQVNLVFWLAVFVMAVGFGFVLAGVFLSLKKPQDFHSAELAAISGIITQFIGATFMVIYRSTMRQANEFMSVLERINTVGMAVHELDRIPEQRDELKNQVRAHLVESLIGGGRLHSADEGNPKSEPS